MIETDDALRRLTEQVGEGIDVRLGGPASEARRLLAAGLAGMADHATIVSVASPVGELSLSSLIAQLSGRPDFDGQDDGVLALGFKRLTGTGRTVLTVLPSGGISRSALRYLQHVSRHAPRLVMVIAGSPALETLLDEPQFEMLRARLRAAPPIETGRRLAPMAMATAAVPPPIAVMSKRDFRPARGPALWLVSGLSAAVVVIAVWAAQSLSTVAATETKVAYADVPLEAAIVPVPPLARSLVPAAADSVPSTVVAAALPALVTPSSSVQAKAPPIGLAAAPSMPQATGGLHPSLLASLPLPPAARAERLPALRRANLPRRLPMPSYPESARYEDEARYDDGLPAWVRRDMRRRETSYIGTYAVDPYGQRIFQYDH